MYRSGYIHIAERNAELTTAASERLAAGNVRFAMIRSVKAGRTHDPLAGGRAKVERAFETLGCLDLEITEFLQQGPGSLVFQGDVTEFANESKGTPTGEYGYGKSRKLIGLKSDILEPYDNAGKQYYPMLFP